MKSISKEEAIYIRRKSPNTYIVKTSKKKKSKRGKYWVEETKKVNRLLDEFKSIVKK